MSSHTVSCVDFQGHREMERPRPASRSCHFSGETEREKADGVVETGMEACRGRWRLRPGLYSDSKAIPLPFSFSLPNPMGNQQSMVLACQVRNGYIHAILFLVT